MVFHFIPEEPKKKPEKDMTCKLKEGHITGETGRETFSTNFSIGMVSD